MRGIIVLLSILLLGTSSHANRADAPPEIRTMEAVMLSCQDVGAFAVNNEVFACSYVGTLGGDLAGNPNMPLDYQQDRLKRYFKRGVLGTWLK